MTAWHDLRGSELPQRSPDSYAKVEQWRRKLEVALWGGLLLEAANAASYGPQLEPTVYEADGVRLDAHSYEGRPCLLVYARHQEQPLAVQGAAGTWSPGTLGHVVAVEAALLSEVAGAVCSVAVVTDNGDAAVYGLENIAGPVLPEAQAWLQRTSKTPPPPGPSDAVGVSPQAKPTGAEPSRELIALFDGLVRAQLDCEAAYRRWRPVRAVRDEREAAFVLRWEAEGWPRIERGAWVARLSGVAPHLRYNDVARHDLELARKLKRTRKRHLKFGRASALK